MNFYDKYIETVTKNDERTRLSVDAIMGRMDTLLCDPDRLSKRISGLVVGRVQSGKTRNYIGLALKAADAGWNVIIVLTSAITALAKQTETRIKRDFKKSKVYAHSATALHFLEKAEDPDAECLTEPDAKFFFWGVAMKGKKSLERITNWMNANKQYASHMRVLVIDDEADNATPNSNAGKDDALLNAEKVVQDAVDAMQECEDDDFTPLAEWVETLQNTEMPDEAANTPEAKTYNKIKDLLKSPIAEKKKASFILADDDCKKLLMLDQPASADDEWGDDLAQMAEKFFSATKERSPASFIKLLKAIFEIANGRSTINNAIISLVDKTGKDATEYTYPFDQCAYIAYTATPYACILNERPDQTEIYADFIASIEKSPKYFGLDEIYGRDIKTAKARMDIIRSITPDEKSKILNPLEGIKEKITGRDGKTKSIAHKVNIKKDLSCVFDKRHNLVWQSLKDAIAWAFCCAAARRWHRLTIDVPELQSKITDADELKAKLAETELRWTTMLLNVSQIRKIHKQTTKVLEDYLTNRLANSNSVASFEAECKSLWDVETKRFTAEKFCQLFNSFDNATENYGTPADTPSWNEIAPHLAYFFKKANRHVIVINSTDRKNQEFYTQTGEAKKLNEDQLWFVCGGNTIARGLTLDGLVASYFDRVRKTVAVDTMTQMGRWFGYRIGYELLPRIWMTPESVTEMKKTAVVEDLMHAGIKENFNAGYSPSDQSYYQPVMCYGRRLTGRDKAKSRKDAGTGTYGSTNDFSTVAADVSALFAHGKGFLESITTDYALSAEEQSEREAECQFSKYPLWRDVPKGVVVDFLKGARMHAPDSSSRMLNGLVREIENSSCATWHVVLANDETDAASPLVVNGKHYELGTPTALNVANGIAHYNVARPHMPYYADIPTTAINAIDFKTLRDNLDGIVAKITAKMDEHESSLPTNLENALAPYPSDKTDAKGNLTERFNKFLEAMDQEPYEQPLPSAIHARLSEGFRNRSSSGYMEAVHEKAGNSTPILQLYFLKPPVAGLPPFVSIAFYWPKHSPDGFYTLMTGLEDVAPKPSRKKFYEAVEEVLAEYDFPMPTKMLRNTVMDKLGPGCTATFFNNNIAKIPEGRNYEPVPKREAYVCLNWGGQAGIEKRLDVALLAAAVEMLQQDGEPHKMTDLYKDTLAADEKLSKIFRAGDAKAKTHFNKLITPQVLAENHIAKICGKPITYQYQG